MGLELIYEDGQTPLDEDEKEGLLIKSISTRSELDEQEQLNIESAVEWTLRRKFNPNEILSEDFIHELQKKMFRDVWRWAGEIRKTNKNLGVDKYQIPTALRQLCDDCKYWIAEQTYSKDEIAVQFKHRIVSIHCYSNGNGRHSRLIGDVIVSHLFGGKVFSWGSGNIAKAGDVRTRYLEAIRMADKGVMNSLIEFARS